MASVSELLSLYETTESLSEAKSALDRIGAMEYPADLDLGECYEGLSEAAADGDNYELAVQAQRCAVKHGCRLPDLARDMLAWYLLKAGEKDEAEAVFATSLMLRGNDPELHGTIGTARADSGDHEGALRAFDRAIELAEADAASQEAEGFTDRFRVERLRAERQETRHALGLSNDESDESAVTTDRAFPQAQEFVVAWFPRGEIDAALGAGRRSRMTSGIPMSTAGPSRGACATSARRPGACRVSPRWRSKRSSISPRRMISTPIRVRRGASSRPSSEAATRPSTGPPAGTILVGAARAESTSAAAAEWIVRAGVSRRGRSCTPLREAGVGPGRAVHTSAGRKSVPGAPHRDPGRSPTSMDPLPRDVPRRVPVELYSRIERVSLHSKILSGGKA